MMSIRTFFCFGLSIPFYSNKRGMDRPEQKRVWIDPGKSERGYVELSICLATTTPQYREKGKVASILM